jgi:hypothetical protein
VAAVAVAAVVGGGGGSAGGKKSGGRPARIESESAVDWPAGVRWEGLEIHSNASVGRWRFTAMPVSRWDGGDVGPIFRSNL